MAASITSFRSFDPQTFLSQEIFPDTIEKTQKCIEGAEGELMHNIHVLLGIPDGERTFNNTSMAYHQAMLAFDVVERMIRSERLLPDNTPGKAELLQKCVEVKNQVFSDSRLLRLFITYTEKMLASSENLSSLQWQYLKGQIQSVRQESLPSDLVKPWQHLNHALSKQECASYEYVQGKIDSKVIQGEKRELSLLTCNLCFMPMTSSMWHGGLVPWPDRMDRIVAKFKTINPDIICLQEVYDESALKELQHRFGDSYAHFYGNVTPRIYGFNHQSLLFPSGLVVISKFALGNMHFDPFAVTTLDKPSGCDRLNLFRFDQGYGLFHFDVTNDKKRLMHLGTTHLSPFFAEVRASQMAETLAAFERVKKESFNLPLILCGDLNIEKNDLSERGDHLIKEAFDDPDDTGLPTNVDFNDYWLFCKRNVEQFRVKNHAHWTVDRILPSKSSASQLSIKIEHISMNALGKPQKAISAGSTITREDFEDQLHSDHDGVLAKIELHSNPTF